MKNDIKPSLWTRDFTIPTAGNVTSKFGNSMTEFKFILYRPQIKSDISSVTLDVTLSGTEMPVLAILKQKPDSSRSKIAEKIQYCHDGTESIRFFEG